MAVTDCVLLVPGHLEFGMIIGWVHVFLSISWVFRECDGCVLLVLLTSSVDVFTGNAAGIRGSDTTGVERKELGGNGLWGPQ